MSLRQELRSRLGNHPPLFLPLVRLKRSRRPLAVRPSTELVIEGPPRSGNTFAVAAFTLAQPGAVVIAHHLHVPAQIIKAADQGKPALVLIRKPVDAIVSRLIRNPSVSAKQALKDYIRFYERIEPYRCKYIVAPFEEIVTDFGAVIKRLNRHFGTSFAVFEHTEENTKKCFQFIDELDKQDTGHSEVTETTVARPSPEKEQLKRRLNEKLQGDDYRHLIDQAETLYRRFTASE
jgi:hypothetical protein